MKKAISSIISVFLILTLVFGSAITVFAAEKESIVTSYGREFGYAGKLELGKTNIKVNNDELLYYSFTAESDGYYVITYPKAIEGNQVAVVWSLEKVNGEYEEVDGCFTEPNFSLFRFESGVKNIGIIFAIEYEAQNAEIEIQYLGSELTDISFPDGTDYPLINNIDIMHNYSEYYALNIKKFSLVFNSGKSKEIVSSYYNYLDCTVEGSLKKSENTVVINFDDKQFTKTLTVAEATDYVKKIELVGDNMKVVKYYDNRYDEDTTAQFKITYKDGSTVTAKIDEEIDLKTGNPNTYTLVCHYTEYGELEDSELFGAIRLAGHDYLELEVEICKASASENIKHFFEEIGDEFHYVSNIGNEASKIFEQGSAADTLRQIGSFVSYVNNNFIYAIGDIFEQFTMLITSFVS